MRRKRRPKRRVMIALNILEIKDFMNKLLCGDTFDPFLLREAAITGSAAWSLDGTLNRGFYSEDELEQEGLAGLAYLPFSALRPQCFALIRGKRTPSYFKFVFLLSPSNLARTLAQTRSSFSPSDITGLFINLRFQDGTLLLTTGVSYRIFSTDKRLEQEWDSLVKRFLKGHEISFSEL